MKKKENLFNFDSIPLSKTKESYLNINYQNPLLNLQPAKNNIIQNFQVKQVQQVQQPQTNQAKVFIIPNLLRIIMLLFQ